jgi:hypothetical protein
MIEKLTTDFETQSECDLKKSGAYEYSMHPTTIALCLGFKSDLESDEIRKNMEQDLINKLNTNKIRCINKIVSKRSKKFIFK